MESFNEVKKKYDKLVLIKGKEVYSCILVGNKCDLGEELRKVPTKDAEEFAHSKGIPFLEVISMEANDNLLAEKPILVDKLKENQHTMLKYIIIDVDAPDLSTVCSVFNHQTELLFAH